MEDRILIQLSETLSIRKACAYYQKYPEIIREHTEICIENRFG